jgi:hypothetical protein
MAAFVERASLAVRDGLFGVLDNAFVVDLMRETEDVVRPTKLHRPKAGEVFVIRVENEKGRFYLPLFILRCRRL